MDFGISVMSLIHNTNSSSLERFPMFLGILTILLHLPFNILRLTKFEIDAGKRSIYLIQNLILQDF